MNDREITTFDPKNVKELEAICQKIMESYGGDVKYSSHYDLTLGNTKVTVKPVVQEKPKKMFRMIRMDV